MAQRELIATEADENDEGKEKAECFDGTERACRFDSRAAELPRRRVVGEKCQKSTRERIIAFLLPPLLFPLLPSFHRSTLPFFLPLFSHSRHSVPLSLPVLSTSPFSTQLRKKKGENRSTDSCFYTMTGRLLNPSLLFFLYCTPRQPCSQLRVTPRPSPRSLLRTNLKLLIVNVDVEAGAVERFVLAEENKVFIDFACADKC
jgi:hypothetical protein